MKRLLEELVKVMVAVLVIVVLALLLVPPTPASACGHCWIIGGQYRCSANHSFTWCVSVCDESGCICDMGGGCIPQDPNIVGPAEPFSVYAIHEGHDHEVSARQAEFTATLRGLGSAEAVSEWCARTPGCKYNAPEKPAPTWGELALIYR